MFRSSAMIMSKSDHSSYIFRSLKIFISLKLRTTERRLVFVSEKDAKFLAAEAYWMQTNEFTWRFCPGGAMDSSYWTCDGPTTGCDVGGVWHALLYSAWGQDNGYVHMFGVDRILIWLIQWTKRFWARQINGCNKQPFIETSCELLRSTIQR